MKLKFGILVLLFMLVHQQPLKAQQGKKQLLPQNAHADSVAIAPNERWMAFAIIGTSPEAPSGIYITTPDGNEVTRITEGITPGDIVSYASWSPDSNKMLFEVLPSGKGSDQIIVATPEGKILSHRERPKYNPSHIANIGPFGPWRFDSKAYFVRIDTSSPTSQLAVIGLDGKEVTRSPELTTFTPCSWSLLSPDGKTFIDIKDKELILLDSLTFNMVAKFPFSKKIDCAGWSPDGKMLLIGLNASSLTDQMVVIDTTGKQLGSFEPSEELYDVQWSYQSTVLAAISLVRKYNTASVTFYTIAGKVLGSSAMYVHDPMMDLWFSRWESDDTYFILTPKGQLVALATDGSVAHDFAFKANASGPVLEQPSLSWSPNKKMLVVDSPNANCCSNEIWIYTSDGKLLRTLEGQGTNDRIFWSADSASLIVLGKDRGIWLLTV